MNEELKKLRSRITEVAGALGTLELFSPLLGKKFEKEYNTLIITLNKLTEEYIKKKGLKVISEVV